MPGTLTSKIDIFLPRDSPVSSVQQNGSIMNKVNVSPFENMERKAILLSKMNSILIGKQCARHCCFYNTCFASKGYPCFHNSCVYAYFEQNEYFCNVKTLRGRKYAFQKINQFSLGYNVPDTTATIHGFFQ
jgi:hypothetical protein